jgi:hypothetical protein
MAVKPGFAEAITAYIEAVEQRIYIFDWACRRTLPGLQIDSPPTVGALPHIQRNPRMAQAIFKTVAALWGVIYPVIVSMQACAMRVRVLFSRGPRGELPASVGICTSYRLTNCIAHLPADDIRPDGWLTVPGVALRDVIERELNGQRLVRLEQLITPADIRWAWSASLHLQRAFAERRDFNSTARIVTIEAFNWFLLWRVLSTRQASSARWWYCNHYDPWAILLDRLPAAVEKIVVQHGAESEPSGMPMRLRSVSTIYTFDKQSEEFFRDNLLEHPEAVRFRSLHPGITLSPLQLGEGFNRSLLIVGSPFDTKKEIEIARLVRATLPHVLVILKPHPLYPDLGYRGIDIDGVNILRERSYFPVVDVVAVTYSTLGLEYQTAGVTVIWHEKLSVEEVMTRIAQVLQPFSTMSA